MTGDQEEIRPELAEFAKKMEAVLKEFDYKSEWEDMTYHAILDKIRGRVDDLQAEHTLIMRCPHKATGRMRETNKHTENMSRIAIHLANYCMFLNHNYQEDHIADASKKVQEAL